MDDIDHLIANSQTNSFMFYIDSRNRNRLLYPNPNEYAIQFATPFRNVYSIQVVDSLIPRTHYNVDTYSNSFGYTLFINDDKVKKKTQIPIGNYSSDQFLTLMNQNLQNLQLEYLSYPGDVRKQFVFKSDYPFEINIEETTMKEVLGFDGTMDQHSPWKYKHESMDRHEFYESIVYVDTLYSHSTTNHTMFNNSMLYIQLDVSRERYHLNGVQFNISSVSERCTCEVSVVCLTETGQYAPTNNVPFEVEIDENTSFINATFHDYAVLSDQINTFVRIHFKRFQYGDSRFSCSIESHETTNDSVRMYTLTTSTVDQASLNANSINLFKSAFNINVIINTSVRKYSIVPPGLIDLTGDTYINMRCKEIENHMGVNGNRVETINGQSLTEINQTIGYGLAKFKLGVMGYQEERFDFTAFEPRDIHPIGKLSNLTFRFERWDGSLYNFRGVNHTLTLIIRYYSPKIEHVSRSKMISQLNPSYDPSEIFH
jgi:hypothetical protein